MKRFSVVTIALFFVGAILVFSLGAIENPDASIPAAIARGITGLIILAVAARKASREVHHTK